MLETARTGPAPFRYARVQAPPEMQQAAAACEVRFGIDFETLSYFPRDLLRELHGLAGPASLPSGVTVASHTDPGLLELMGVLTRIANLPSLERAHREGYRRALLEVYRRLTVRPEWALDKDAVLYLAPEREGRILAEALGWLPPGHSLHPHAKRIPLGHGLLVGTSRLELEALGGYSRCILVDGAIASGATLVTLMDLLRPAVSSFSIYSVHGAPEGIRAIVRSADRAGVEVTLSVGHVSGELNGKLYAMEEGAAHRFVVGDLGDIISPLERNPR
jgi:hypothetical protein